MLKNLSFSVGILLMAPALAGMAQSKSVVVEEVVARVNNEVITRSDLEHARGEVRQEAQQDCPKCTPEEIDQKVAAEDKNVLRDLIDNSLLVQHGKDMGVNVEADVIKRLDDIRIQNNIPTMEELETQIDKSGVSFEDFKNNIRNQLLQQEVIRKEVGSKIILDHATVLQYYNQHKNDYVRPEAVTLREIFVSTEGKSEAEIPALRKKADDLLQRVKNGEDFGELAKHFSDGSTAKQGGDLGKFERGQLASNIEQAVFALQRMQTTDVIPTKTGFLILQVGEHYTSGLQPEEKVENEIMDKLYNAQLRPALREYLETLREDSYVMVKPGYTDTGAVASSTIEEVPPTPDDDVKGKKRKSQPTSATPVRGSKPD
ncbi:MAG TPA: peptidylprolyl isomerase [Candidatus Acidoferrales bacterium]|nr:peptidylprolyl isomerase [Candidatus Acidoferrales bacterium]